jgi:hypothetical protein
MMKGASISGGTSIFGGKFLEEADSHLNQGEIIMPVDRQTEVPWHTGTPRLRG